MSRKYYAEVATWGRDYTSVKVFNSKEERDEFCKKDYTNKISAAEAHKRGF